MKSKNKRFVAMARYTMSIEAKLAAPYLAEHYDGKDVRIAYYSTSREAQLRADRERSACPFARYCVAIETWVEDASE